MDTDADAVVGKLCEEAKGKGMTDTLVLWRQYVNEYPRYKYNLLYLMAKAARSRKEPYPRTKLKLARKQFNKQCVKYPPKGECFLCEFPPEGSIYVRHHVIPLSKWGTNRRLNIVTLCNRCHSYFHPWLRERYLKIHEPQSLPEPKLPTPSPPTQVTIRIDDTHVINITIEVTKQ